jgi:hypothetical protein
MDGTGEYHSEQGQPGSEDQKSYVLPHINICGLQIYGKCSNVVGLGSHDKGRAHIEVIGIGRKPKT